MKIAIIMGSQSDFDVIKPALVILKEFGLPFDVRVLSAHRTPKELDAFLDTEEHDVYIAAAGGAAHLAGTIAARTVKPVIGIPIESKQLKGLDSLLSTVQMPSGIPCATVAINGSANAALLAVQILGVKHSHLMEQMQEYRKKKRQEILNIRLDV